MKARQKTDYENYSLRAIFVILKGFCGLEFLGKEDCFEEVRVINIFFGGKFTVGTGTMPLYFGD